MAFTTIQLPPGLERNNTPYDTPNRWWDMSLVRWQSGSVKPIGGNQRTTSVPLNGAVRKIFPYRDNNNSRVVLVGTENKLYVDQGSYTNITPSSFVPLSSIGVAGGYGTFEFGKYSYGNARPSPSPVFSPFSYWTFGNWGEDVILTANSDGRLFYYDTSASSTAPTVVTSTSSTVPTSIHGVLVTEERHVMCVGFSQGGTDYSRSIGWSSREDYTDWDFASTTNTAGTLPLAVRTPLQKGVKVREGVLVFSLSEVFLTQYIGLPYIYNATLLSDISLFHPDSIIAFNGKAAWLGRNGFQMYNGGVVQPMPCPILNDIADEMDPTYGAFRVHGCHHGMYPELWWFYPTAGNTEANRYVIYNYAEDWWAWGYMSRSAMSSAEVFKYPYAGDASGDMFQQEIGYTDSGVSRIGKVYIESGMLGAGNGDVGIDVTQALIAAGTGYNSVQAQFYSRWAPEGAERTFGPYSIRSDGYMDTRVSGRDIRVRFTAAQDADFGIGQLRLNIQQGTGR